MAQVAYSEGLALTAALANSIARSGLFFLRRKVACVTRNP